MINLGLTNLDIYLLLNVVNVAFFAIWVQSVNLGVFLRLPSHNFAAHSRIDFATCSPPQQDCQMIADTWAQLSALQLSQNLYRVRNYDSLKFSHKNAKKKWIKKVKRMWKEIVLE